MPTKILTNSSTQTYRTCPRKYQFAYEVGLSKKKTSEALRMGSAFHEGLDIFAKGYGISGAVDVVSGNYEKLIGEAYDETEAESFAVEGVIVLALLEGYFERWKDSSHLQIIESEIPFEVKIRNPDSDHVNAFSKTFLRSGKLDKIIRWNGRHMLMEHKTTSEDISPGKEYWLRLRIDHQISGYVLGARELGYQVEGILYDVIRKPGIRPKKIVAKDRAIWNVTGKYYGEIFEASDIARSDIVRETPAMFGARLAQAIHDDPDRYYQRQEIARLESDLDEYQAEFWGLAAQIRESRNHNRWYRNAQACLRPYRCQFADLCFGGITPSMVSESVPEGFEILEDKHPELITERTDHAQTSGIRHGTTKDGPESPANHQGELWTDEQPDPYT